MVVCSGCNCTHLKIFFSPVFPFAGRVSPASRLICISVEGSVTPDVLRVMYSESPLSKKQWFARLATLKLSYYA